MNRNEIRRPSTSLARRAASLTFAIAMSAAAFAGLGVSAASAAPASPNLSICWLPGQPC